MSNNNTSLDRPDHFLLKWSLIVFILWALFLSFEYYANGSNSYVKIGDNAEVTLALKLAHSKDLRNGQEGIWDWHQLAGTDSLTEVGALDFLNLVFDFLPGWLAYAIFMFLQRFVAGYFTFRLLVDQFNVRPSISLFSAFFYSLFMQGQINSQIQGFTSYDSLGLPGVPVVLFFIGLFVKNITDERKILFFSLLLGFVYAGVSFFAYSIFFFPLIFLWAWLMLPRKNALLVLLAFSIGWMSVEIFEIIPAYTIAQFSQRTLRTYCDQDFSILGWWYLIQKQIVNTSNGLPFLLGICATALPQNKRIYKSLWVILILALAFFAMGIILTYFSCSDMNPIPLLKGFNTSRFYLYFPFLVSVLAGLALQNIFDWQWRIKKNNIVVGRFFVQLTLIASIILVIASAVQVKIKTENERLAGSNFADIYENPYLQYLASYISERDPRDRAMFFVDISAKNNGNAGYLWAYGVNTFDGYANLYTLRFRNYFRAILDPMMTSFPKCRYGIRLNYGETRLNLNNHCEVNENVDISHPGNLFNFNLLNLAAVRYFVSTIKITHSSLLELDTSSIHCDPSYITCTHYFLYENQEASPFIYAISGVRLFSTDEKVLNRIKQAEYASLARAVLVNAADVEGIKFSNSTEGNTELNLHETASDIVEFNFESTEPRIVVISATYTKDWKVYIDEDIGRLFPAYYNFIGIFVPEGNHLVRVVYAPKYSMNYLFFWIKVHYFHK